MQAWTRELGTQQGRIQPTGWVVPEGDYAFVLGFDSPKHTEVLKIGDYAQISQTADFKTFSGRTTGLLRVTARLRGAYAMPTGTAWKFSLLVEGVERTARILPESRRVHDRVDLAANVAKLAGTRTITLRVELIAV